jgi:enterochelin esterase-like enzyme
VPETAGQVIVEKDLQIRSEYLQKQVSLNIILPADYYESSRYYPVVYLLHGLEGDHKDWIALAGIDKLIDSLEIAGELCESIYVLPDAGNTYYINNYNNRIRYEDFFVRELVPYVDSAYRAQTHKSARSLMGLSMGGYGSIILAMKHPDTFGTVVALSASVRNNEMLIALPQKRYESLFSNVYGPHLYGKERITEHWIRHSPYYLIDSLNTAVISDMNWYMACGLSDSLLPANRALHNLFENHQMKHTLVIDAGEHNWSYWRSSAIPALQYLNQVVCSRQ